MNLRRFRAIHLVTLATLTLGIGACDMLKKMKGGADADAEADAATAVADPVDAAPAAPAPVATGPVASNEDDVARFPDETKLESVAATVQRYVDVREVPQNGKVVSSLNKGAAVAQVAQRKEYFLVVFDNPKDTSKKMMGWVHSSVFSAVVADAGVKVLTCAAGETPLVSDGSFCGKVCEKDADCAAGQACKGSANKLLAGGKAGDAVTVCTVFVPHDAGAPNPNVTPPPKFTTDAGTAPVTPPVTPPPTPAGNYFPAPATGCPAEFIKVNQDGQCHRKCKSGVAGVKICGNDACVGPCGGFFVCTSQATRSLCK